MTWSEKIGGKEEKRKEKKSKEGKKMEKKKKNQKVSERAMREDGYFVILKAIE